MSKRALITGITGYVGRGVARRLLEDGFEIIGLVRNGQDDFQKRVEGLRADLGEQEKLTFVRGDLMDDSALKDLSVEGITHIVHSAAVTRFNVEADLAQAANVDGSRKIFEWAKWCPQLECFSYISTVYACGLVDGEILETRHQGPRTFANHYENSKFDAEALLQKKYGELPWQIMRVATIIADDDHGRVTQQNAFHNTLKLFFYGLLSLVPGKLKCHYTLLPDDLL